MSLNLNDLIPVFDDAAIEENEKTNDVSTSDTINNSPEDVNENTIGDDVNDNNVDSPEDKNDAPVETNQVATLFFKELANHGLATDDKEEYSFEDVEGLINNYTTELPKQVTNDIIMSAPEIGQKAIDFIFTKGADLSKEDLREFVTAYLEDMDSTGSFEDIKQARDFMKSVYQKQNMRENVIEVMLDTLEDDDALLEEANKIKGSQTKKSDEILLTAKQEEANARKEQEQFLTQLDSEFTDLKWNRTKVSKIKQSLLSGVTNDILRQASTSPKALIQLADFVDYWDPKTKSFNFDSFIKKVNSNDTLSLKDKILQDSFNSSPKTKGARSTILTKFKDLEPVV